MDLLTHSFFRYGNEKSYAFEGLYTLVLEQTGCVSWAAPHALGEAELIGNQKDLVCMI